MIKNWEKRNPRQWNEAAAGFLLVAAPVLMLLLLVLLPSVAMIADTFAVGPGNETGPGFQRYVSFFNDAYSVGNLKYTIALTLISCVTSLVISFGIALYLRFSSGKIAAMVHALSLFPLFVPAIIVSYALIRFLGPNGMLQLLLEKAGFPYYTPYLTPVGPFLAFVWESLPLPVLVLTAGLAQVSDSSVEAARDLGAGGFRILTQILLPQVQRSLLIAFSLVFLGVIGSYTIPYLLGPPAPEMMGVFIRRTLSDLNRPEEAGVQATILLIVAAIVAALYISMMKNRDQG